MQDDKPEQTVSKVEETSSTVTKESEKKEFGLELAHEDMDIIEDEGDCILEDVLLIDSEDGIDEDTIPSNENDNDGAKPTGIIILLIM